MTEHVLVQVHLPGSGAPDLAAAASRLGVPVAKLDAAYGVVPVDLPARLYAVRVESDAASKLREKLGSESAEGIYADVKIEPMGPPER